MSDWTWVTCKNGISVELLWDISTDIILPIYAALDVIFCDVMDFACL